MADAIKTDQQLHQELKSPSTYKAAKEQLIKRINQPVVFPGDADMLKQRNITEALRREL